MTLIILSLQRTELQVYVKQVTLKNIWHEISFSIFEKIVVKTYWDETGNDTSQIRHFVGKYSRNLVPRLISLREISKSYSSHEINCQHKIHLPLPALINHSSFSSMSIIFSEDSTEPFSFHFIRTFFFFFYGRKCPYSCGGQTVYQFSQTIRLC